MRDKRITGYIADLPVWQAGIMRELRDLLHDVQPDIEETFKWGSPTFERNGIVAWMFAAKEWVHFSFPQGVLLHAPDGLWEEDEDTQSRAKRTIKFKEGSKIPAGVLEGLIKQAVGNNIAGKKVDFGIPKRGERHFDVPHNYEHYLKTNGLWDEYQTRPYFQQKGWVHWIEAAKHDETREKRKQKMLQELRDGTYMPPKQTI